MGVEPHLPFCAEALSPETLNPKVLSTLTGVISRYISIDTLFLTPVT